MKWIAGRSPTSYQGGGLTLLYNHDTSKYEMSFAFGYLEFDKLPEFAQWVLTNDIKAFAETKTTEADIQAFHAAKVEQAKTYVQPAQLKMKTTVDPTVLLKKLGLV